MIETPPFEAYSLCRKWITPNPLQLTMEGVANVQRGSLENNDVRQYLISLKLPQPVTGCPARGRAPRGQAPKCKGNYLSALANLTENGVTAGVCAVRRQNDTTAGRESDYVGEG